MKNITSLLALFTAIILLNCNPAENGFNAPTGSTVAFISPGDSFDYPDEGPADQCFESDLTLATLQVQIPIGTSAAPPEATSPEFQAGNKIQGVLTGTNLYKFKDGVETFLPLASLVDPVAGGTMAFVTNDQGLFTLAYTVFGCYDGDGAIMSGTRELTADIGVAEGVLTITIQ